eukprot:5120546-Alexandrium_andersonii.AAC.1
MLKGVDTKSRSKPRTPQWPEDAMHQPGTRHRTTKQAKATPTRHEHEQLQREDRVWCGQLSLKFNPINVGRKRGQDEGG